MPVKDEAARAHHAADPDEQRLHVVDPAEQPSRDGGRGAEDDHEDDRRLALLEQEDRKGEPRDGRHRLQAEDRRADRPPKDCDARHDKPDGASRRGRDDVTDQRPAKGDRDADIEVRVGQVLA